MGNVDISLYDSDFYLWTQQAAESLRSGVLASDDLEHVAEEIADIGKRDRRELESRMMALVMHLIKWAAQPQMRETSTWLATINEQRTQIEGVLAQSPSLRALLCVDRRRVNHQQRTQIEGVLTQSPTLRALLVIDLPPVYTKAAKQAAIETRIPLSELKSKLGSGEPLPANLLLSEDFLPEHLGDLVR